MTDVHTHLVTSPYLDYLRLHGDHPAAAASLPWLENTEFDSDALLYAMDAAGVDVSWVSYPPPGVIEEREELALRRARELNERLALATTRHSDRLRPVSLLPMPHTEACQEVLAGMRDDAVAAVVHLHAANPPLDAVEVRPLLRDLADRRTPLIVHPGVEPLGPLFEGWGLGSALSAPVITTATAVRLIVSGALDEVPHLELILCHLGGVLPLVLQRLEDQAVSEAAHGIRHYLRRQVRFDSVAFDGHALRCAAAVFGVDRIVLGSDTPFRGPQQRAVEAVQSAFGPNSQDVLARNLYAAPTAAADHTEGARR
ncbi:amidohydrolase family protein [Actinoallomurus acanthiterrae]